jgi:hypothetical protein
VACEWSGHKRLSIFLDAYQGLMPGSIHHLWRSSRRLWAWPSPLCRGTPRSHRGAHSVDGVARTQGQHHARLPALTLGRQPDVPTPRTAPCAARHQLRPDPDSPAPGLPILRSTGPLAGALTTSSRAGMSCTTGISIWPRTGAIVTPHRCGLDRRCLSLSDDLSASLGRACPDRPL